MVSALVQWLWSDGVRKKEITLIIQKRYVIVDAKRQQTGLVKVQTDFCQGKNTILGHDYPPGTAFS